MLNIKLISTMADRRCILSAAMMVLCGMQVYSLTCGRLPLTTEMCCEFTDNNDTNSSVCVESCPVGSNSTNATTTATSFCEETDVGGTNLDENCSIFTQDFFDDCIACHPQCVGCTGPLSGDCIRCRNATHNGSCVDACPENTSYNASTRSCRDEFASDCDEDEPCPPSDMRKGRKGSMNYGLIIGLPVAAAVVLIASVILVIVCVSRHRRKERDVTPPFVPPGRTTTPVMAESKTDGFPDSEEMYGNMPRVKDMSGSIMDQHDNLTRYTRDPTIKLEALEQKNDLRAGTRTEAVAFDARQGRNNSGYDADRASHPRTRETWMNDDPQEIYENNELIGRRLTYNDDQELYLNYRPGDNNGHFDDKSGLDAEDGYRRDSAVGTGVRKSELEEIDRLPLAPCAPDPGVELELYGNMDTVQSEQESDVIYENYSAA